MIYLALKGFLTVECKNPPQVAKTLKFTDKILRRTLRPWVKMTSSVHFPYLISFYYLQSNTIIVHMFITSMHCHSWSAFYLHSSPESEQFPQSPGPGPDILVTGSCRSLCRKREKNCNSEEKILTLQ